jgi:hypothetical protein
MFAITTGTHLCANYELYGYRLNRWNKKAEDNMRCAWCPFMNAECDGGGNRFQSAINAHANAELNAKFPAEA